VHLGCPVVEGVFGGRRRRRGEVAVEDRACADFIARSGSNVVGRNIDPKFKRSEVRLKPEAGAGAHEDRDSLLHWKWQVAYACGSI
jgi:hypothetical protein